jgi:hypothetical protein
VSLIKMNPTLFIIRTPLQLFNAIEARNRFHKGQKNHLFLFYKKEQDKLKLEQLLDSEWTEITWFEFNNLRKHLYPIFLRKLHKNKFSRIYVGLITNIPIHIVNITSSDEVYLLDDGNEVIAISKLVEHIRSYKQPKRNIKDRILGRKLDLKFCEDLHYFSSYQLKNVEKKYIIENDYRRFKENISNIPKKNALVFIGSNLVGNYFPSEQVFLSTLEAVYNHNKDKELFYCPHRYEPSSLIMKVKNIGFQIIELNPIIEVGFLKQGWLPSEISTFRSTAFDTLRMIYQIPGHIYRPKDKNFLPNKISELTTIYEDYIRRDIKVINLKD